MCRPFKINESNCSWEISTILSDECTHQGKREINLGRWWQYCTLPADIKLGKAICLHLLVCIWFPFAPKNAAVNCHGWATKVEFWKCRPSKINESNCIWAICSILFAECTHQEKGGDQSRKRNANCGCTLQSRQKSFRPNLTSPTNFLIPFLFWHGQLKKWRSEIDFTPIFLQNFPFEQFHPNIGYFVKSR